MFNNKFNSTKKDPLVEAVQSAMQDGEIRRQAVAQVNEAFGVYNRNAVVREQLAAYDAAIEEAYKCMKEGNPLDPVGKEDDDIDNDGKRNTKSDKYLRNRRQTIGRAMNKQMEEEQIDEISNERKKTLGSYIIKAASKKPYTSIHGAAYDAASGDPKARKTIQKREKGIERAIDRLTKEETQIDEISKALALKAMKRSDERGEEEYDRDMNDDRLSDPKTHWDRAKRLRGHMKRKFGNKTIKTGGSDNLSSKPYEQGGGERRRADKLKKGPRAGMISAKHRDKLKDNIKYSLGKHKKPNLPEETQIDELSHETLRQYSSRAVTDPTRSAGIELATSKIQGYGHAKVPAQSPESGIPMKEATYSAKAARAGKDIGKPGKEFKRIAKSAAARYGSEERGKKVAGAILKRIRAKHMKEEQIEEIVTKDALAKSGLSLRDYMNKERGLTRRDSSTSRPSVTSAPKTNTPGTQGVATGKSFSAIDKATAKAEKATPKVTAPSTPSAGAARDVSMTGKAGGETGVTSGSTVSLDRPGNVGARPTGAGAAGTVTGGAPTPAPSSPPEQSRAAPGTFAARSASGEMKADAASAGVKKLMSMNESVQVGANKYRIV